jgi:hypothetical protein
VLRSGCPVCRRPASPLTPAVTPAGADPRHGVGREAFGRRPSRHPRRRYPMSSSGRCAGCGSHRFGGRDRRRLPPQPVRGGSTSRRVGSCAPRRPAAATRRRPRCVAGLTACRQARLFDACERPPYDRPGQDHRMAHARDPCRSCSPRSADDSITKAIGKLIRADLIIIDDVGLLPVSTDSAEALFRVVDAALRSARSGSAPTSTVRMRRAHPRTIAPRPSTGCCSTRTSSSPAGSTATGWRRRARARGQAPRAKPLD